MISFFLEVFFISVTHHIAHRDSLLVDCRKTLWVVASENLYRVVVGGHTAYWQHLVCTLSSGQRRYPEVVQRLPPRRSRVEVGEALVALERGRRAARRPFCRLVFLLGVALSSRPEPPSRFHP